MRGAFSGSKRWSPDKQLRFGLWRSGRAAALPLFGGRCVAEKAGAFPGWSCDFFLFYLTPASIFDNRHGLLKKFDSWRAAETLSAVKPQRKC